MNFAEAYPWNLESANIGLASLLVARQAGDRALKAKAKHNEKPIQETYS
jgi:hypothetical protein